MIEPSESQLDLLLRRALAVRQMAYAPYSQFSVGAAILTATEDIYVGCNVENASFSLTLCAERAAAMAALSAGQRQWVAITVVSQGGVTPCGACRQFLAEFGCDLLVLSVDAETKAVRRFHLSALLPDAFGSPALPLISKSSDVR